MALTNTEKSRRYRDRKRKGETVPTCKCGREVRGVLSREWGILESAKPITQIVKEMIEAECYGKLLLKGEIIWDVESIHDAINEACISLGLDEEEFSASYQDKGNQIDLRLI